MTVAAGLAEEILNAFGLTVGALGDEGMEVGFDVAEVVTRRLPTGMARSIERFLFAARILALAPGENTGLAVVGQMERGRSGVTTLPTVVGRMRPEGAGAFGGRGGKWSKRQFDEQPDAEQSQRLGDDQVECQVRRRNGHGSTPQGKVGLSQHDILQAEEIARGGRNYIERIVGAPISEQLCAFIGATAFEDLCREWTLAQARAGRLPFVPQAVSSHWGTNVQVDVVALSWREKAVLLGECKWGVDAIPRSIVTELIEDKTPRLLAELPEGDEGWRVYYAFFTRVGLTPAAATLAAEHDAQVVNLQKLDQDLSPP